MKKTFKTIAVIAIGCASVSSITANASNASSLPVVGDQLVKVETITISEGDNVTVKLNRCDAPLKGTVPSDACADLLKTAQVAAPTPQNKPIPSPNQGSIPTSGAGGNVFGTGLGTGTVLGGIVAVTGFTLLVTDNSNGGSP